MASTGQNVAEAAGLIRAAATNANVNTGIIGAATEQSNQISLSPAEQAIYDRDMQPFVKNAIEAVPKLTLTNFSVWRAHFEMVTNLLQLTQVLHSPTLQFTTIQNLKVLSLITTRLDPAVYINVITPENAVDAKLLWAAINDHFAAVNPANRARIHAEFIDIVFDVNNIQGFITAVNTVFAHRREVGIVLPEDIVAYDILNKLPYSMSTVSQQITHSGRLLTPQAVLDHLRLYANDLVMMARRAPPVASTSLAPVALFTDPSKMCKRGAHNSLADHPEARCYKLYPHLRPGFKTNNARSENSTKE
ncbi:hypothetical protein PSHT_04095 [Puccinia striiformis]|uniref:Uncharacterized protein n=1 Tax=Puccinia striiformis TaxID=27350 RepID=A0A2S4WDU5_9BASI|nr:hypothetical protein PSHT_04095 [Puccinia striiformis]